MLYFYYGTVASAKTLNLLASLYSYKKRNKKTLLVSPLIDSRFGIGIVKTRAGLEQKSDIIAPENGPINFDDKLPVDFIFVDEAQFLSVEAIEQLQQISLNTDVFCYGIRVNFKRELFPASKRLMELSDIIQEIPSICSYCNSKSSFNLKFKNGKPVRSGNDLFELDAENMYMPVCSNCFTTI